MELKLSKGNTQFAYGFSSPEQLMTWFQENPKAIGVAFVGRSNVGKSSLINTLFGRKTARTSKTPGRTREINIFNIALEENGRPIETEKELFLFDLPGYGHAEISKEMARNWDELMQIFFGQASTNIHLINVQDARHPLQTADTHFLKILKKWDGHISIAFNKLDKLKTQKDRAKLKSQMPKILEEVTMAQQIFTVSAEKKTGVPQLESGIVNHFLRLL